MYTWSSLPEGDAVELGDPVSDRRVVVRRPVYPIEELVRLEELAFRGAREAELFGAFDTDPLRVLDGLNWLLAFWTVLWDLRTTEPADEMVSTLDYLGPWRGSGTPERDRVWQVITERVRGGVLAALTGDPRLRETYEQEVNRLAPDIFLHVTLTIMEALAENLARHGLELEGMTARIAAHTTTSRADRPPFSRPH